MNAGKVTIGVLAGVATGTLLGVLFAPDKGSETRKKITKKGHEFTDTLNNKLNEFLEGFNGKFREVKETVTNFAERNKTQG